MTVKQDKKFDGLRAGGRRLLRLALDHPEWSVTKLAESCKLSKYHVDRQLEFFELTRRLPKGDNARRKTVGSRPRVHGDIGPVILADATQPVGLDELIRITREQHGQVTRVPERVKRPSRGRTVLDRFSKDPVVTELVADLSEGDRSKLNVVLKQILRMSRRERTRAHKLYRAMCSSGADVMAATVALLEKM